MSVSLSSKTYDELVNIVRQSFKNACVLYIDKIINPDLLRAYERRRAEFISRGVDPNEQQLFHGSVNGHYEGDSGGDGSTIFLSNYDDACIPEYVICFHKSAKV